MSKDYWDAICVWSIETRKVLQLLNVSRCNYIYAPSKGVSVNSGFHFSPDGTNIVYGYGDGLVRVSEIFCLTK
jgi:hypothetical protein